MNLRSYPDGLDFIWIASDRNSNIGAFASAGIGPVPMAAFKSDILPVEDIEEALYQLPKVSSSYLIVPMIRPDDFIEIADRGIFVYDWQDIHRCKNNLSNLYEQIAFPQTPITVEKTPSILKNVVNNLCFDEILFNSEKFINIQNYFKCNYPNP